MAKIISFNKETTSVAVFKIAFDNGNVVLLYRDEETCGLYLAPIDKNDSSDDVTIDEDDEILLCYDNDGFVYDRIKKLMEENSDDTR